MFKGKHFKGSDYQHLHWGGYKVKPNKKPYVSFIYLTNVFLIFFLYDGKVWKLLCDLSFGDDLSHNPGWTQRESNGTPRCARPAC